MSLTKHISEKNKYDRFWLKLLVKVRLYPEMLHSVTLLNNPKWI